ncbi:helix-turn-helix domain-containing protein [Halobacteria archaeon AArc-m2/3/4]|uniref:Helix-turn-helix domain-containing protein n=1 Tax=Natronoglomus mannanivorans TaxID=2979990 RepID=A0ABT2QKV9_9EURY|nr:helix-turn-helix domain-containing protein [Halobacteria archaeon AArc-m2/3/4]
MTDVGPRLKDGKTSENSVKTTTTTFTIVEALKELGSCGVTELVNHVKLLKSTVHNYLSTLE